MRERFRSTILVLEFQTLFMTVKAAAPALAPSSEWPGGLGRERAQLRRQPIEIQRTPEP